MCLKLQRLGCARHVPLPSPRWRSSCPGLQPLHEGSWWSPLCPELSAWCWMDGALKPQRSECHWKQDTNVQFQEIKQEKNNTATVFQADCAPTCPAGPWGSWECWGPGGEEGRWRGQQRESTPGGSTASHSALREPLWSLRGPPYLERQRRETWLSPYSSLSQSSWFFRTEQEAHLAF